MKSKIGFESNRATINTLGSVSFAPIPRTPTKYDGIIANPKLTKHQKYEAVERLTEPFCFVNIMNWGVCRKPDPTERAGDILQDIFGFRFGL